MTTAGAVAREEAGAPPPPPVEARPGRRPRAAIALTIGLLAAGLSLALAARPGYRADFDQVWSAASALLGGANPYTAVGPGLAFDWPFPLYYPMPAVLLAAPLALLPLSLARALFVGGSSALLAYLVTRDGYGRLPIFLSGPFLMSVTAAQWSPLLTAAYLLPALAWMTVAKPNLGAVLAVASPTGRFAVVAALGGAALAGASFLVQPTWAADWLLAFRGAPHFVPPVMHLAGPVILLALLRWRRPEARLLLGLACVPHTTLAYEALPLLLVARRFRETLVLAALSAVAYAAQMPLHHRIPITSGLSLVGETRYGEYVYHVGTVLIVLMYLPALVLVLRRPNEGLVPVFIEWPVERVRRWLGRGRGG